MEGEDEEEMSVLTAKLHRTALQIGKAGLAVAVICFTVMFLKFCISRYAVVEQGQQCFDLAYHQPDDTKLQEIHHRCLNWARSNNMSTYCGAGMPVCEESTNNNFDCVAYFDFDTTTTDLCKPCNALPCEGGVNGQMTVCQATKPYDVTCRIDDSSSTPTSLGRRLTTYALGDTGLALRWESNGASSCDWHFSHLLDILDFFVAAITILIVAIPEGLPLAVILSLSYTGIRMERDHNLVKHLDACETMGSATTICSDKTGTLTQNRMSVVKIYTGSKHIDLRKAPNGINDVEKSERPQGDIVDTLAESISVNSAADVEWDKSGKVVKDFGNKTDCALLGLVRWLGHDYAKLRDNPVNRVIIDGVERLGVKSIPFSSKRKRSSLVVPRITYHRHFVKGASEVVLSLCTQILTKDGIQPLTEEQRKNIREGVIDVYAKNAMRTICMAYRDFNEEPGKNK